MRMIVAALLAGFASASSAQAADLSFLFATTAPGPSIYISGSGKLTIDEASGSNGRYRVTAVNGNYIAGILREDNTIRDRSEGPLTKMITEVPVTGSEVVNFITFSSDGTVTDFEMNMTNDNSGFSLAMYGFSGERFVGLTVLGIHRAAISIEGFVPTVVQPPAVPEPATWAMMLGGFGLVGSAMRRRTGGMKLA